MLKEFMALLPKEIFCKKSQLKRSHIATVVDFYADDLPSEFAIDVELQGWTMKWKENAESVNYDTTPKALAEADETFFPNIHTLLHIAATSPVTSVVCERSISTLRLLKPSKRSTMTNERMNSLAMMFIHRKLATSLSLDLQAVVDEFATCHARRMALHDLGAETD